MVSHEGKDSGNEISSSFSTQTSFQIIREFLPGAAAPKKKRKRSTQIGTPHSTSTGDIPETPGTSPTGDIPETPDTSSTGDILETPCTSDRVGNIFYAPLLSYHGHNILEADPSPTTCTTCEYNKKKKKALLKMQNQLKKKYKALQQSYNKLRSTEPAQPEPEEEVVYKESEEEVEERGEQVDCEEDEQSDKKEEVDWAALEESAGEYSSQSDGEDDEKESCNTIRCCETSSAAIKGWEPWLFLT
ncbi:hypothetical protein P5673_027419 [Acropora cervicornis]|uniref:Uncharacterized protein n=1 Tax=Acropora cervicornis TaxID=6130 RepID=A0AAD9UVM8_ACRCE|nr:hypothetical protein P5673_027419 [Acropora cervicornis]